MCLFFLQAEDGIRDLVRSRGLGDVYKRQTKLIDDLLGKGTVQCARAPYGSFNDDTLRAAKKHLSLIHI